MRDTGWIARQNIHKQTHQTDTQTEQCRTNTLVIIASWRIFSACIVRRKEANVFLEEKSQTSHRAPSVSRRYNDRPARRKEEVEKEEEEKC